MEGPVFTGPEDDTAGVSVGLATTADGSPEERPESEKLVGNDV